MLHFSLAMIILVRLSDNLTVAHVLKSLWACTILPSFSPLGTTGLLEDRHAALQRGHDHPGKVE